MQTKIEWADMSWNPVTGCSKISAGCKNCYAERMAKRLAGRGGYPTEDPFSVTVHPDRLLDPAKWKKPRRIFVCSMGDLFHDDVPEDVINNVFTVAERHPRHTFMFLTKRPKRMARAVMSKYHGRRTPQNFWFGVTAENQEQADRRIPILLQVPAASVRFVSVEPMLGPVDLKNLNIGNVRSGRRIDLDCLDMTYQSIHLVICGGETGPGHRPMAAMWARDLLQQCHESDVAFFFKQMAGKIDTPAGLNIRELPGCDQDDTRMAANGN